MRHVSTTEMIKRLSGMVGTNDLTEWETDFVKSVQQRAEAGGITKLTERQVETLDRLHGKHFA